MINARVEIRLERLAGMFDKFDEILDKIPGLPAHLKETLKSRLTNTKELQELRAGINERRPPRFVLVGRTGVGKSSLINAMTGRYLAEVSDVAVGTTATAIYSYESTDGSKLFEVLDTRGVAESETPDGNSAEDELRQTIAEFKPDAILFLTRCKERAHLDKDVSFLASLTKGRPYTAPVVAVLPQADEMEPSRVKDPREYPERKLANIQESVTRMEGLLAAHGVETVAVLPVSSYVEWSGDPSSLESAAERKNLAIVFDGRYQIKELVEVLAENMDLRASLYLNLATGVNSAGRQVSRHLTNAVAATAGVIAATPIPFSDIYILLVLQAALIMMIAYLAGEDLSFEAAKKVLVSLSGLPSTGFALRTVAQQASKLLNGLFPGAGSAVSSGIAIAGTRMVGSMAESYYFDNVSDDKLRQMMASAREAAAAGRG